MRENESELRERLATPSKRRNLEKAYTLLLELIIPRTGLFDTPIITIHSRAVIILVVALPGQEEKKLGRGGDVTSPLQTLDRYNNAFELVVQ